MSKNAAQVIENALSAALTQYEATMDTDFPAIPRLEMVTDPAFWASAEMEGDQLVISVTTGLVETVTAFWELVFGDQEDDDALPGTADDLTQVSLVWLMLHELHHYQMGHFTITGRRCLTEARDPNGFGVVTRATASLPDALKGIALEDLPKIEPCLEMQADHDAIEMILDAYSTDGWDIIRARTAGIAGMMVLIEREDAKHGHALSSHPKAATRIFQLLGHVIEMPMIEAKMAADEGVTDVAHLIPAASEQSQSSGRHPILPRCHAAG